MALRESIPWRRCPRRTLLALLAAAPLALPVLAREGKIDTLRIGTSGSIGSESSGQEKGAVANLKSFIKDETGLNSEIIRQSSWQELADKMAKKQLEIGVFQGYEYAWAQAKHPGLKPLALSVNVYRYPVAYVVAQRDDAATDFAGLKGQSLALPQKSPRFLRFYVERQAEARAKDVKAFFSKITTPANVGEAIDEVVDGKVQAAVADRAALESYKERKPGRFNRLKEVAHSRPFPPPVIAYSEGTLDEATLQRFRNGLLNASKSERGETMLTLFGLTGFEPVPDDFGKVLAETREAYPPDKKAAE